MTAFLTGFLFILIVTMTVGSIKDFVIESEDDLRRIGQTEEVVSLNDDENDFADIAELMLRDGCNNVAASHPDIYDSMDDNYGDEIDNDDDDAAVSLNNAMKNGQLDVNMLRRAIKKLSEDPRYAAMFEHARLHEGIPNDMEVQDYQDYQEYQDHQDCQEHDNGIDMFYNADLIE